MCQTSNEPFSKALRILLSDTVSYVSDAADVVFVAIVVVCATVDVP